ncbi:MAG: hypothetical protein MHMPM18_000041 [Marteilia pararefringens]
MKRDNKINDVTEYKSNREYLGNSMQNSINSTQDEDSDIYFLKLADAISKKSPDPNTKVGCVVGDHRSRILLSSGFNDFPKLKSDYREINKFPNWNRSSDDWLDTKYPYVIHAEVRAIIDCLKSGRHTASCGESVVGNSIPSSESGLTLYTTLFPCNDCAKVMIESRIISRVVYSSDKYHDKEFSKASRRLFEMAGIEYVGKFFQ